jgi:hypothetical protein
MSVPEEIQHNGKRNNYASNDVTASLSLNGSKEAKPPEKTCADLPGNYGIERQT